MKIIIEHSFQSYDVKIWCFDEEKFHSGQKNYNNYHFNGEKIEIKEFDITAVKQDLKPLVTLPVYIWDELVREMAEQARNKGISTEKEERLQGKTDAMKDHIEDMRMVVKSLLPKLDK